MAGTYSTAETSRVIIIFIGGPKGVRDMPPPPHIKILSISSSFWEFLTKSCVRAPLESLRPHLGEILDLPLDLAL